MAKYLVGYSINMCCESLVRSEIKESDAVTEQQLELWKKEFTKGYYPIDKIIIVGVSKLDG